MTQQKRILVFAREDWDYLLRNRTLFLDGTFNNCPRQFTQLCSLRLDLGSTSHENCVFPVMFALLPVKEGTMYPCLLVLLKSWCSRPPKIIYIYIYDKVIYSVKTHTHTYIYTHTHIYIYIYTHIHIINT